MSEGGCIAVMWVVFEVTVEHRRLWAWCKPSPDYPGFDDVAFTTDDGVTPVDAPDALPPLGVHLFTIPNARSAS